MCTLRGEPLVDARNIVARWPHCVAPWTCGDAATNRWNAASRPCIRWHFRLAWTPGEPPPAFAERVGQWAADHTQRHVLAMLASDHDNHWSCPSLRKVLASLSAGMAPHRHLAQVEHVVHWVEPARASKGR